MRTLGRITAHLLPLALLVVAASVRAADVIEYYDTDAVGNVRLVTDAAGNVVERHDYLPFGEEWCGTAVCGANRAPGEPLRFTGKERDAETGLDYFGARYYRANTGRFTTVDPDHRWNRALADPQRWNRYSYSRNNALKYVDPSGGYFVVAAGMQKVARQYISTMLRSEAGAKVIHAIASDSRPSFFAHGNLPHTATTYTPGQTLALAGASPGPIAGTRTTLDNGNIQAVASRTGASEFYVGLKAFAHESFHSVDELGAATLAEAAAAGANGDAPSAPGRLDTTGGTAEGRALEVMGELGKNGSAFEPNRERDQEADRILSAGDAACSKDRRLIQN